MHADYTAANATSKAMAKTFADDSVCSVSCKVDWWHYRLLLLKGSCSSIAHAGRCVEYGIKFVFKILSKRSR